MYEDRSVLKYFFLGYRGIQTVVFSINDSHSDRIRDHNHNRGSLRGKAD